MHANSAARFVGRERDVPGERAQQVDVGLRRVLGLLHPSPEDRRVEGGVRGETTILGRDVVRVGASQPLRRSGHEPLVAVLHLVEEAGVAARHVVAADDRDRAAGTQRRRCLLERALLVEPVPRVERGHDVERFARQRPLLERRDDDFGVGKRPRGCDAQPPRVRLRARRPRRGIRGAASSVVARPVPQPTSRTRPFGGRPVERDELVEQSGRQGRARPSYSSATSLNVVRSDRSSGTSSDTRAVATHVEPEHVGPRVVAGDVELRGAIGARSRCRPPRRGCLLVR